MSVHRPTQFTRPCLAQGLWSCIGALMLAALVLTGGGWGALHASLEHAPGSRPAPETPAQPDQSNDDCLTCHLVRTLATPEPAPPTALIGATPLIERLALPQVRTPAPAAGLRRVARGPPLLA